MISFKELLYENLFSKVLVKEGGNALENVDRIPKKYIQPTVTQIINQIIIPLYKDLLSYPNDIFLLGSTGKKETSGDIDIGIDFNKIKLSENDTIMNHLKKIFKQVYNIDSTYEIQINSMTNDMIHIGFPQYNEFNEKTDKFVQVDILLTEHPIFCKFYMYSPTEIESKYKGAHRNELLRAIAKTLTFKPIIVLNNEILKWEQNDLNSMGYYHETKTLIDENGNRLKYKNTDEDLIPSYAKILTQTLITNSPTKCIHILVGNTYTETELNTFEKLFNIILNDKNFKYSNKNIEILHTAAIMLKENNKLVFPSELEKFL